MEQGLFKFQIGVQSQLYVYTWYLERGSSLARLKIARADLIPSVRLANFIY